MFNSKILGYAFALILILIIIWAINREIRENLLKDDPILHLLKDILQPLQPFFSQKYPDAAVDIANLKLYKGEKSYTINKDQIFLCLKNENDEYYPVNMLVYVLLHELSHKNNTHDVGHTPMFYKIFDETIAEARKLGVYNGDIPVITNYCGGD